MSNDLEIDQEIIDRGNKQTNIFKEDSDHPANILYQSGYNPPVSANTTLSTMSKEKTTNTLGEIYIRQLDAQGAIIESWTLHNPIIKNADFGGQLSYDNEGLIEVKMTLAYDWATLETANAGAIETANGINPSLRLFP